jgi:hypothetical protein
MFYFRYLIFTNKLFVFLKYYIPNCNVSLLLNKLFNFSSNYEDINNINDKNINKNNKYIKIIHKSVSIERMDDVNFDIDDGPIYI